METELNFKDFGENLQQDLDIMTFDEIVKKYKTTKKQMKEWIKEYNLEVKYLYRTPYTNGLIPAKSYLTKYFKNKEKQKQYNSLQDESNIQNYLDTLNRCLKECEFEIGSCLCSYDSAASKLQEQTKRLANFKFLINLLEKVGKNNYFCYICEERYGIRPDNKQFDVSLVSENILYAYISQKYGMSKMLQVKHILDGGNI